MPRTYLSALGLVGYVCRFHLSDLVFVGKNCFDLLSLHENSYWLSMSSIMEFVN